MSKLKYSIFPIIFFLFLGLFLDITKKIPIGNTLFCMGGGKIDRLSLSLDILKNDKNINSLIYLNSKAHVPWQLKRENKPKKLFFNQYDKIIFTKHFKNTFDELMYIQSFIQKNKINKFTILSDPYHSRRIDFLIKNFTNISASYSIVGVKKAFWNKYFYYSDWKAFSRAAVEFVKLVHNSLKYILIRYGLYGKQLVKFEAKSKHLIHKQLDL